MEQEEAPILTLEIKNTEPVDLLDLTSSLEAFANQYRTYAKNNGHDTKGENIRLYIKEIRSGSIITDLFSLAEQASFILDHIETLAGFVTHINEITDYFLGKRDEIPETSKNDLADLSNFIEITAKDQGSSINATVKQGNIIINNYSIGAIDARSVQNGIDRKLSKTVEDIENEDRFTDEALVIWQVRDDLRSKAGDKGKIDKFSKKALKLLFTSEDVKKNILDHERVFKLVYLVNGKVISAGGEPVAYKISELLDTFDRPE